MYSSTCMNWAFFPCSEWQLWAFSHEIIEILDMALHGPTGHRLFMVLKYYKSPGAQPHSQTRLWKLHPSLTPYLFLFFFLLFALSQGNENSLACFCTAACYTFQDFTLDFFFRLFWRTSIPSNSSSGIQDHFYCGPPQYVWSIEMEPQNWLQ